MYRGGGGGGVVPLLLVCARANFSVAAHEAGRIAYMAPDGG